MKIRITKKGLPKAQMWNSQVGEEFKSNNQPNNNWVNFTQPQVPMPRTTVVNPDGSKTTTGNFGEPTTQYKMSGQGTPLDQGKIVPIGQNNNDFIDSFGAASMALKGAITAGNMLTDYFGSRRKIQEAKSNQYRDNLNPETADMFRGNYMTNSGVFQPDKLPTPNEGMLAYGGTSDKLQAMKIRIVSAPDTMAYGGQTNYGLDLGAKRVHTDMPESKMDSVSNTIGPVPRSMANIEAEQGETIYGDLDGDGGMEHMNIGGKRHSEGGTPLNAPDGSFIFSDTKKMKIKDPNVLKMFGGGSKSVTPAQLAKKYNINKYKAIMEDPNADALSKSTAQIMVKNYESKLANLALVQESMKGFPQGIPQIAAKMMEPSEMAYGGYLPQAQNGKQQVGQVFTPDFQNLLAGLKKDQGYDLAYSPRILAGDNQIPMMQSRQKSGLYGDVQTNELDEFKKRHDWYFANNPNWNPANKANVADFQNKYEQEYAKKYGYSYFGGKRKFDRADGFFGEYTYNAPALSKVSQIIPPEPKKPETLVPPEKFIPNKNTFTGNEKLPFGYMTPDVVNMFATAAVPPKIAMGFRPKAAFTDGNYSLEDWLSKAQQRQQVYNQSADAMGTYGPSSALASNLSFMAGQTGDGIASDIANVAGRNVDRANVAMSTERQRKDQNDLFNLAQSQELYKDNVIARQQYDNARRNYLGDMSKSFSNAWNNRMNLGLVNATNPMYNINPLSGRSYFKKGYNTSNLGMMGANPGSEDYWARLNDAYTAARAQSPDLNLTSEQFLRRVGALNTTTDRDGDGVPDSSSVRRQMPFGGYVTYPF